jgi:hypothetical protein
MGLVALLLVLGAGAFSHAPTEAAPPDPYADLTATVQLTTGCVAVVSWPELKGGKPLFIQVRLSFNNGGPDDFTSSLAEGSNGFYKVQQNDGRFELDLSGPAAEDDATLHRISVSFVDRKGMLVGPIAIYEVEADCAIS